MVHNEAVFFPIWLRYYSRFFGARDIYVLDHGSTDGSTNAGGFVRIPVHRDVVDWAWHRDTIQEQQHRLIAQYDVVVCCDADEIVAPDPHDGTLGDYLDRFDRDFVNCTGYEVLHMNQVEPAIDLTRPILDQRAHWFRSPAYSKPLIARVPMYWHGGFHARVDGQTDIDPRLALMHLHRMDYQTCLVRHHQRRSRPWNQRDLDERWGYQNLITEPAEFAAWFYNDSWGCSSINVEPIPEHWKGLF
jgi:hypothetical protein